MKLGLCSRTGDVVEPLLKPQWYVNCDSMAKASIKAVEKGELELIPDFHKETWNRWLSNIHDWCISRQLWWGHRIPAYFVTIKGKGPSDRADGKNWVVGRNIEEATKKAVELFKVNARK